MGGISASSGNAAAMAARYRRPFANTALFNVPIPASPTVASNSAAIVTKFNSWSGPAAFAFGTYNSNTDFDIPVYQAKASDPTYTISTTVGTYPYGAQIQGMSINIPSAAKPSGGSDAHMAVIDPAGDWYYEFWTVTTFTGGSLVANSGSRLRVHGDGLGCGNAIASKTGGMMGLITPYDLEYGVINHAIAILCKSTDGTHVWPAAGNAAAGDPTNAPPCGTWFQLNMTPSAIVALGLPKWETGFLIACATYGMVVIDIGGSSWNIRLLDDATTASFGGAQPNLAFATRQGSGGNFSANGSPPPSYYADAKTSVPWSNLRVLDPTYMQGLYEARMTKLDPVATISNNFSLTGAGTANACLVDVYPPLLPTNTLRVQSATNGQICEVSVATLTVPTGQILRALVAWLYIQTDTGVTTRIDLESGTTVIGTYTMASNSTFSWYAVPSTTVAGITLSDIRIKLTMTATAGGFCACWGAHVQPEYT